MALGDVKASGGLQTQLISGAAGQISAQANSGLGDAVNRLAQAGMGYLNSKTDIEAVYDRRAQASTSLDLDTKLLQYQKDRAMEFTEFSRGRSSTPSGMTRDYDATLAEREQEFIKNVPPRFQEEFKAKLAQDRATRVASAFSSELTLLDTVDTNNLNTSLNALGSAVKSGGASLADAQANWEESVAKTALPAEQKQSFIASGRATLQGLEFGTRIEVAASGFGTVRDGSDGSDIVMAGASPGDRAVLNVIAKNEAQSYDVWNGGTKFQGYADHPAALGKAPGESTAAGRYQFILGTWRLATASYEKKTGVKVPDFSPEWQDRVAAHWAEHQFNKHYKNASYRDILASGDPQKMLIIRDVLGRQRSSNPNDLEWQGLGKMKDHEFIAFITGDKGFNGGGTGTATMPNPWTDPEFSDLSLENKMGFANAASAAAEQNRQRAATEMKLERSQFQDDAYNAGYLNQPGLLGALEKSRYWDAEAQAKYNSGQEVFRASERAVGEVGQSLAEGSPLSINETKNLGKWFGADSLAGIISGDVAAYKKMQWTVERARVFPDGSADAFMAAMGNPQTSGQALGFLASALAGDSSILKRSGFDTDTIAQVRLYKNLAAREASPEEAMKKYSAASTASERSGKTATQLATEANNFFVEKYPTIESVIDKWDGYLNFRPDTKFNPATEGMLMLDASTAYRDGFAITGTAEGADAYMQTALDNLYGVSQTQKAFRPIGPGSIADADGTTRSVLMRIPPEKYYPAKDEDWGYLYTSIADFAQSGGATRNGAVLIPDDQTEKEARAGKPPTYKVYGVGELGEVVFLEGRFGGDALLEEATKTIREEESVKNSLDAVNEFAEQEATVSSRLEFERANDSRAATFGGGVTSSAVPDLEAELASTKQKREAAVVSALELGHIDPEVASGNADVIQTARALSARLSERLQSDSVLARRFVQASAGKNREESAKVMSKLIAKELKVPATLADLIALELSGM